MGPWFNKILNLINGKYLDLISGTIMNLTDEARRPPYHNPEDPEQKYKLKDLKTTPRTPGMQTRHPHDFKTTVELLTPLRYSIGLRYG